MKNIVKKITWGETPIAKIIRSCGPFWRSFWALSTAAALLIPLFILNLVQMATLVVYPFSIKLFRQLNREMADAWWGKLEYALGNWWGLTVTLSGDDIPPEESALVMSNHCGMIDIPALFGPAKKARRLGDMKWFVKHEVKHLPGIGWGLQFLDCLFVKRSWHRDQGMIRKTFDKFITHKIPLWLMIFPEGTRLTPEKLDRSQRIAEKKGLKVLKNVLLPRTKGVVASIQGLRGHINAVYDFTIGFEGKVPTIIDLLLGRIKRIHLHVKRIPLAELPLSDEDLTRWVYGRFEEKDERLGRFAQSHQF